MLEDFLKDEHIGGIIIPSILGMTADKERRDYLLNLALEKNKPIIFVDERIKLDSVEELYYINSLLEFITDEPEPDLLLGHTR
jgi:hypothetical protein